MNTGIFTIYAVEISIHERHTAGIAGSGVSISLRGPGAAKR